MKMIVMGQREYLNYSKDSILSDQAFIEEKSSGYCSHMVTIHAFYGSLFDFGDFTFDFIIHVRFMSMELLRSLL